MNRITSVFKARVLPKLLFYGLLLGLLYQSALTYMVKSWEKEQYTYGYLMPLVILYLLWERREKFAATESRASWMGIIPLLFGLGLFWLGELGGEYLALHLSFWFAIVGLCLLHLGWEKIKTIWFPLFMIVTMFPIPNFFYNTISVKLQLISSQIGVSMLQVYGLSAYREGNVIDLGFTQLQVVEACSGLHSLISLVVLGILLAYFFKGAWWKRAILVLSTVPLSIFTNSIRIAATGILFKVWGAEVAEGFFHGFSGWLIFVFGFGTLLLEMWVLGGKGKGDRAEVIGHGDESEGRPTGTRQEDRLEEVRQGAEERLGGLQSEGRKIGWKAQLVQPQFVVGIVLLGATLALAQGVEFRERVPISEQLSAFPLEVGEWNGTRVGMEQRFIETLDFSDYAMINYKNGSAQAVDFYVAYYESQRKGESIHSPETCLPGGGWIFKEAGVQNLPEVKGGNGAFQVNRGFIEKGGSKQLVYFWFPARGRVLTNAYQLKLYTFWDALTRQRTDGALVRVMTPVYPSENLEKAEGRLRGFVGAIVPVMARFIPE